ncbi:MAG TPA: hypothetical protein VNA24_30020 [Hyalangium sp.]|jgi:hypothetical protein|nr:hypothetical protein [Hyalangium sp.]
MSVNKAGGAPGATGAGGAGTNFKASDLLGQDGNFHIDFESEGVGKQYGPMLAQLGETSGKNVQAKVEAKMTEWIKAHPGADQAAVDAQLRKTLQIDTMQYKMLQDGINKMMKEIENKMKEIANDRFG